MNENIILIYPPQNNYFSNKTKNNDKNNIEIDLYNKSNKKIIYNINQDEKNIFQIENNSSIINPKENQTIKIYLNKDIEYQIKKYELKLSFFENNNNKIPIQTNIVNLYLNEDTKLKFDVNEFNKYSKFKTDLKQINNDLKLLINKEKNRNIKKEIKFKEILFLIFIIILCGIFFGNKLLKIYIKLTNIFTNKNKITKIEENQEEFEEVNFMTKEESEKLIDINEQNKQKYIMLRNFNFLDEIKKNKEIKEKERIKKIKNKLNNSSNFICFNIIYLLFFFFIILNI